MKVQGFSCSTGEVMWGSLKYCVFSLQLLITKPFVKILDNTPTHLCSQDDHSLSKLVQLHRYTYYLSNNTCTVIWSFFVTCSKHLNSYSSMDILPAFQVFRIHGERYSYYTIDVDTVLVQLCHTQQWTLPHEPWHQTLGLCFLLVLLTRTSLLHLSRTVETQTTSSKDFELLLQTTQLQFDCGRLATLLCCL